MAKFKGGQKEPDLFAWAEKNAPQDSKNTMRQATNASVSLSPKCWSFTFLHVSVLGEVSERATAAPVQEATDPTRSKLTG